jgi:pyrroline-5-carboxylate reductase
LAFGKHVTAEQQKIAKSIFEAVGEVVVVTEDQLDAVTGLSGSGPAYIYMVIEALIDGGVKMGLSRDISTKLAIQTVLGSAKLAKSSGLHPAILRDQVTTPGGTTINAIHELESHGLRSMLIDAVATATHRSEELSKIMNNL